MLEWGIKAVTLVAVGFLMFLLRGHQQRISNNEEEILSHAEEIARLDAQHRACQETVSRRLARGDQDFDRFDEQIFEMKSAVVGFKSAVDRLDAIHKVMEGRVKTLDDRIYDQQGSFLKGGDKR